MSLPTLDPVETRVVGALAEKALATPDHYPLTVNALISACNQKSSRDPVTDHSEREVRDAVERLMRRNLAGTTTGSGHRAIKMRHLLDRALDLSRRELAVLTVLLLRGAQTAGEIRTRTNRLADFVDVADVEETLWLLSDRDEPLVVQLPRAPGQSTDRFAHRLSGNVDLEVESVPSEVLEPTSRADNPTPTETRSDLEDRVVALEAEVERLGRELAAFKASFE
ncbi:YceH family protein [Rubrivirga sp.]|uniref:YceH family protein n=1 Tax=Rubrivirga sp. TaxID=1885344 RepID=UPI003C77E394